MENFLKITSLLKAQEDFCFVRFNDGEMMGIRRSGAKVARGHQVINKSLQSKLIEAINHRQKNYWIGKPCGVCFPDHRTLFDEFVDDDYEHLTHAAVLCNNSNWRPFIEAYVDAVQNRYVYWISGGDQNIERVRDKFDSRFHVEEHVTVPRKNGWAAYDSVKNMHESFKGGAVINLSCGPMSRVLAYEWFRERPDCTFLDIGSTFDPFTRNVWHKCHKSTLSYCSECNFSKKNR